MRDNIITWSKRHRAGSIVLVSPDGDNAGRVEIHDRRRPMQPVSAIVDDLRGDLTVASRERLTTSEGEHAAIVTLRGTNVERTLAIVYGDDFHVLVDGVTRAPERFAVFARAVRELVDVYPLGLGEHRYRRFFYTPPTSWQGLARGMVTEWYPLDYPARWASLVVHPAKPLRQREVAARAHVLVHQDVLRGLKQDAPPRHLPLETGRLRGYIVQADGRYGRSAHRWHDIGVLEDDHYRYLLTLESGKAGLDEHRDLFRAVLESCVPLSGPTVAAAPDHLSHWAD